MGAVLWMDKVQFALATGMNEILSILVHKPPSDWSRRFCPCGKSYFWGLLKLPFVFLKFPVDVAERLCLAQETRIRLVQRHYIVEMEPDARMSFEDHVPFEGTGGQLHVGGEGST